MLCCSEDRELEVVRRSGCDLLGDHGMEGLTGWSGELQHPEGHAGWLGRGGEGWVGLQVARGLATLGQ